MHPLSHISVRDVFVLCIAVPISLHAHTLSPSLMAAPFLPSASAAASNSSRFPRIPRPLLKCSAAHRGIQLYLLERMEEEDEEESEFDEEAYCRDPPESADELLYSLIQDSSVTGFQWSSQYNTYIRLVGKRLLPCQGEATPRVTVKSSILAEQAAAEMDAKLTRLERKFDLYLKDAGDRPQISYLRGTHATVQDLQIEAQGELEMARDAVVFQWCRGPEEQAAMRRFYEAKQRIHSRLILFLWKTEATCSESARNAVFQ
jgi:hypothetical protein